MNIKIVLIYSSEMSYKRSYTKNANICQQMPQKQPKNQILTSGSLSQNLRTGQTMQVPEQKHLNKTAPGKYMKIVKGKSKQWRNFVTALDSNQSRVSKMRDLLFGKEK